MQEGKRHLWQPDRIVRRPAVAMAILFFGAIAYAFACRPLFWIRGFPPIDPIYYAAPWLWYAPLLMALVFDDRPRIWTVALYALAIGFVAAYIFGSGSVPRRTSIAIALPNTPIFTVVFLCYVLAVIWLFRWPGRLVRRFATGLPTCDQCGYPIDHLTEPRCPECGKEFDPSKPIIPSTPRPWKVGLFLSAVLISAISLPPVYRAWDLHQWRSEARSEAEKDWSNQQPIWYVTEEELNHMSDDQARRFDYMYQASSQLSMKNAPGLRVDRAWKHWSKQMWIKAYREVIEEKLRQSGQSPPDFGPP